MATATPENRPSATRTPPIAATMICETTTARISRGTKALAPPASRSAIRTPGSTSNAPKATMASAERPTERTSSIMASDTAWPGSNRTGPWSTGRVTPGERLERGDAQEVDVGEPADRHVIADALDRDDHPGPAGLEALAERHRRDPGTCVDLDERDRGRPRRDRQAGDRHDDLDGQEPRIRSTERRLPLAARGHAQDVVARRDRRT